MILLSFNDLPIITKIDGGTWRRMQVIMFKSRFVENVDDVKEDEHIYLADRDAKKRHEENAPYFMSI